MTTHMTSPTLAALRVRFAELFGNPPPAGMRAAILTAAIAWQEQVLVHGDIDTALKRDLAIIARERREARHGGVAADHGRPVSPPAPATGVAAGSTESPRVQRQTRQPASPPLPPASSQLKPGARLVRAYKGTTHIVAVTADGFLHDGRSYRSLSAVAKAITGTHWNGLLFFGLRRRRTPGGSASRKRRSGSGMIARVSHG